MTVCRAPKTCAALAAAIAALLGIGSAAASASQEVGSNCVANELRLHATAIALYNGGSPAPQSNVYPAGVITRWRVQAQSSQPPIQQRLIVNRQVGEEDDSKVGESALELVGPGTNEFATRVPAPEYAHIGLTGPNGAMFCDHVNGNTAGFVEGDWPIGETRHFQVEVHVSVPVVAIVEPDRDNDGFGDETQDGCPQSATYQTECPRVAVDAGVVAKRRSIVVSVTPSSDAKVVVWGQIRTESTSKRGRIVRLGPPETEKLTGGTAARFKLRLPKRVLTRLSRLSPRESLRAKVFVHTIDLAGRPSTHRLDLRLRGRHRG